MAETKPYSLQSPEQIAKDYGGNKQKIAEAMQMGIIDPTAGTLAAMFIDRMRSAAQVEAAPQQTVAQQVFAPPQMPAGLGATPQAAAAMPTPPVNPTAPTMPPAGLEAAMAAPAPEMPAMGMAAGGLTTLPVPDGMFDEPDNGGYAGGGLVAFATGDEVEEEDEEKVFYDYNGQPTEVTEDGEIRVTAPKKMPKPKVNYFSNIPDFLAPKNIYGFKGDLLSNLDTYEEAAPRETARAKEYMEFLDKLRSPEEQKARRKEDMWMALGQIGAKMASTPGSLLQAASAGIGEALPGVAAAAKERRAEQRGAMQAMVAEERASNKEITERADKALGMLEKYGTLADAMKSRAFQNLWEQMGSADRRYVAQVSAAAGITQQNIAAGATLGSARLGYNERRGAIAQELAADFDKNAPLNTYYQDLLVKNPAKAAEYRNNDILNTLNRIMPALGSTVDLGNY